MEPSELEISGERGSMAILMAMGLVAFLGVAALAVDMGYVYTARRQLQVAADAGALAGVRELATSQSVAEANAIAKAQQVATANKLVGGAIPINTATDIQFGSWASPTFTVNGTPKNALRVTLRKTSGTTQGPLALLFGPTVGLNSVEITASGTAVLAAVDMILVLDTSSSMVYDTVWTTCTKLTTGTTVRVGDKWTNSSCGCGTPNASGYQPFDTLRASAKIFISDFNPIVDQLAMETFANTAKSPINRTLISPFTTVSSTIDAITTPDFCNGARYTNIGDGIAKGVAELRSVRARASTAKIIVLVSDGAPTCNSTGSCTGSLSDTNAGKVFARQQAAVAGGYGIVIHGVSLGLQADRPLMQDIAQATGGSEHFANSAADLTGVFAEIRGRIPVQLVN